MSAAASQAAAFYREVARQRVVWTIRDASGYPAPGTAEGRAQPFWSSRSRAERVISMVEAYRGFEPVEIPWAAFCSKWVAGLSRDGIRVGVNWSGARATGFDLTPDEARRNVEAEMKSHDATDGEVRDESG